MTTGHAGKHNVVRFAALLVLAGAGAGLASKALAEGEIKIGVLQPLSGCWRSTSRPWV